MRKLNKNNKPQLKKATFSTYAPNGVVNIVSKGCIFAKNGNITIKGVFVDEDGNYYDSLFNLIEVIDGQIVGNDKKNFYKKACKNIKIQNRIISKNSKNVGNITLKGNLNIK